MTCLLTCMHAADLQLVLNGRMHDWRKTVPWSSENKNQQMSFPGGEVLLEAYISSLALSVCMSPSLEYSIKQRKKGSEGQLGTDNLLREKLNVLSSPINTPLRGDDGRLLGLDIEHLSDMTLSSKLSGSSYIWHLQTFA